MKFTKIISPVVGLVYLLIAFPAWAADYPVPKEGDWVVRDFRFHTGEVLPELRLHYVTLGAPSGEPVLILHGTGGAGTNLLTSRANCSAPDSRSTRVATSSSCRMLSVLENHPSPPMVCARAFLNTTTTIWYARITGCLRNIWACVIYD